MRLTDKTILVVDDAIFMIAIIKKALLDAGYKVLTAASGEQALEIMEKTIPDLILLDVIMPGMNGFEVCQLLRNNLRLSLVPIIIITGQAEEEDKLKGLESGADDYVTKPFSNRELLARVHNTLWRLDRMREVNPLTGLRGNNEIETEMLRRINKGAPYAAMYCDLNLFKPYNDVYGFEAGDMVLRMTAEVIVQAVMERGDPSDFVGHIGGDDFIAFVEPENAVQIAERIIELFEERKVSFFSKTDLENGYIYAVQRNGEASRMGLTGISIALLLSDRHAISSTNELAQHAAVLKSKAKGNSKSAYAISE